MKWICVFVRALLSIVFYLLFIALAGYGLIQSYDWFLAEMNKKVVAQTNPLKTNIDEIEKLKATNPVSLKDIQNYDKNNNTHLYNLMMYKTPQNNSIGMVNSVGSQSTIKNKEAINTILDMKIYENKQEILYIEKENTGFWSDLPKLSTLLLAGFGIFFTALITNFGNFISTLITCLRKWLIGY